MHKEKGTMPLSILHVKIKATSYAQAISQILEWVHGHESRSVYAANVHMLMEAHDHVDFMQIVNGADLVTPDGMPLVWVLRKKGVPQQQRVYGPTLMLEVLKKAEEENIPMGFLGDTEEVLQKLSQKMLEKFPDLQIAVQVSPPFKPLSIEEDKILCNEINSVGVKILFVALGCPKQERWIAVHKGKINAVMIGVGAAFAFHAGVVRQAPAWMQKMGLEWLFRLNQEPNRLWKRYLKNNPRFAILVTLELLSERFHNLRKGGGN
jgi:N-acetylglucosaminyldiphosphoundecaprenol N-acetyl-beta-D-mannosaminyltransferase